MRFSERIGKKEPKVDIQFDNMDKELKNGIWNIISIYFINPLTKNQYFPKALYKSFVIEIWFSFFKEPTDQIAYMTESVADELRNRFFSWDYLKIYDFIEFISKFEMPFDKLEFINACNFILKRELSAFRFVNGLLAPITNKNEINAIENAIDLSFKNKLKGVNIHLNEALKKLSDKKSPDYRNSIKESISAVESICKEIAQDPKAELGKALKMLKNKIVIHIALEKGFEKLYGYTSDGAGIRHALMDEHNLDQEDALYMLISCSAFINYLIVKAGKAGIKFTK